MPLFKKNTPQVEAAPAAPVTVKPQGKPRERAIAKLKDFAAIVATGASLSEEQLNDRDELLFRLQLTAGHFDELVKQLSRVVAIEKERQALPPDSEIQKELIAAAAPLSLDGFFARRQAFEENERALKNRMNAANAVSCKVSDLAQERHDLGQKLNRNTWLSWTPPVAPPPWPEHLKTPETKPMWREKNALEQPVENLIGTIISTPRQVPPGYSNNLIPGIG